MPPEQTKQLVQTQPQKSVFFRVTPFSKYLAMLLFILLPFIGGWIGYTLMPEKIVEVERLVIQKVETRNDMHSYVPEYIAYTSQEERGNLQNGFVNIDEMLNTAPFAWETDDLYRDYKLLLFNFEHKNDCEGENFSDCEYITVIGDTYSYSLLKTSDSEAFDVKEITSYLKSQGFMFVSEVAKGFQFEETYQKVVEDDVQLINLASKPIDLTFPDNGDFPTSQGAEVRLFVSSIFKMP